MHVTIRHKMFQLSRKFDFKIQYIYNEKMFLSFMYIFFLSCFYLPEYNTLIIVFTSTPRENIMTFKEHHLALL